MSIEEEVLGEQRLREKTTGLKPLSDEQIAYILKDRDAGDVRLAELRRQNQVNHDRLKEPKPAR